MSNQYVQYSASGGGVTFPITIAEGGTGQITAPLAINALLPSQTSQSGKFLTTNGTVASWGSAGAGSVTTVSVVSANGLAGTVANATSTPAITLSTSITGILYGNGTAISAATFTGDVTNSGLAMTLAATTNGTLTTLSALTTAGSLATVGTITSGTWNAGAVTSTGAIDTTLTTNATSASTGAILCSGGISAALNIVAGGQIGAALYSIGNSGTTQTINFNNGAVQSTTLNDSCTFTFSNAIAGMSYLLILTQGSGGQTVTWSTTVTWKGGTAPTLSTTAAYTDLVSILYDGTYYYGSAGIGFQT